MLIVQNCCWFLVWWIACNGMMWTMVRVFIFIFFVGILVKGYLYPDLCFWNPTHPLLFQSTIQICDCYRQLHSGNCTVESKDQLGVDLRCAACWPAGQCSLAPRSVNCSLAIAIVLQYDLRQFTRWPWWDFTAVLWRVLPNDCCADRVRSQSSNATSHAFNVFDHTYVNRLLFHMLFALRVFRLVG